MIRCRRCGLRRTWPLPDRRHLQALYEDPGYYGERWMGDDQPDAWRSRARDVLELLGTSQTSILDFGAGDGALVAALRERGTKAEGVERAMTARAVAADRGVRLHPDIASASDQTFSAATMLHVLEHLEDPVTTLAELRSVLQAGGRLLVEVPNVTSVDALWPPLRAHILDLPFHLHHFTPRTLVAVVRRAGFEPVVVRRFNPLALELILSRRRPRGSTEDDHASTSTSTSAPASGQPRSLPAAAWRAALPHVRSALPGMKLQLVART